MNVTSVNAMNMNVTSVNATNMNVTSVNAMSVNAMSKSAMSVTAMSRIATMTMIAMSRTATSTVEVGMGDMDMSDTGMNDGATDMDVSATTRSCQTTLIQGLLAGRTVYMYMILSPYWVQKPGSFNSGKLRILDTCAMLEIISIAALQAQHVSIATGYPQLILTRSIWPTLTRCTLHWKAMEQKKKR